MNENLDKLMEMTPRLPRFPEPVRQGDGFKEHRMTCGHSFSWALVDQPEISCARWFNSAGTEFPEHSHQQVEFLIPYVGQIFLSIAGVDSVLHTGQVQRIEPGVLHSSKFLEDTWYLAVTVPANDDWPHWE